MRRARPLRCLLVAGVLVLGAAAQAAPELDIRIERDNRPRTLGVGVLSIAHTVTVHDRSTGQPPQRNYVVYAQATNTQGEKTQFFACGHTNDVDSRTPPGLYDCSVIVDHGGAWDFVAVVLDEQSDPNALSVPLGQASMAFEIGTGGPASTDILGSGISGSAFEVAVLFGHAFAAVGWFVCVALLSALALPGTRRLLSVPGCHRLERLLDPIVKGIWVTTGLVVGSGVYLTLNQTAYDAPLSSEDVDAVFALPYGRPYFLTLAAKIVLYLVMVAACVPLVRGARRRMLSRQDVPETIPAPLAPAGGGVAVAVRAAPSPAEERSWGSSGPAATAVLAGGLGIALCVTLLKYLHELIEAARGII